MQAGAADAGARQERRQLAVRHRGLAAVVANGDGAFRQIPEQLASNVIGQLVDHLRVRPVRIGIAHRAAPSATTLRPASVSSLAMIAPTQPKPTITASTFSLPLP